MRVVEAASIFVGMGWSFRGEDASHAKDGGWVRCIVGKVRVGGGRVVILPPFRFSIVEGWAMGGGGNGGETVDMSGFRWQCLCPRGANREFARMIRL